MSTFVYNNTFDPDGDGDNLNGATQYGTTGTGLGVFNSSASGDGDNEFVFFAGSGNENKLDLNANITGSARVNSFDIDMTLEFVSGSGPWGDGEPDGFSFNLGDPASLNSNEEFGVSTGLAIQVIPFDWSGDKLAIVWNGVELNSVSIGNASSLPPSAFTIDIDPSGNVTTSFGPYSVSATIPSGEWTSTSQDGWDFVLAGRTGGNSGEAFVDYVNVSANVVCFADGTKIDTPTGRVAVDELSVGDAVMTQDNGVQPVRWIARKTIQRRELDVNPKLRPLVILADALGPGYPKVDLKISRQHRVLIRSRIAERMFGKREILVPAVKLLGLSGVFVDTAVQSVTYVHFICDRHEIVFANGLPSETLLLGGEAEKTIGPDAIDEISAIFPDLKNMECLTTPARYIPKHAKLDKFIARHKTNNKPILADASV